MLQRLPLYIQLFMLVALSSNGEFLDGWVQKYAHFTLRKIALTPSKEDYTVLW